MVAPAFSCNGPPHKLTKKGKIVVKVGPSLKKLSGSAHVSEHILLVNPSNSHFNTATELLLGCRIEIFALYLQYWPQIKCTSCLRSYFYEALIHCI